MLDEIREQPAALERSLRSGLRAAARLSRALESRRPKLIVLAARGTSDNAAQFGRYLLEITTGIPVSAGRALDLTRSTTRRIDYRDALVVAISQSGESTDTNLVLERAREQGALTIGITNESHQRAGAPRRARVPGARRQREKRGRHQDLYRPVADAVSAGLRAGRAHPHRRSARLPERAQIAL